MLSSNIGLAINTHFCGGEAVATTFTFGLHNPGCGMEDMKQNCDDLASDQEKIKPKPCCENRHQVFQVDQTAKLQTGYFNINPVFFSALILVFAQPLSNAYEMQGFCLENPPPLLEEDLQVLFQTFLI